MCSNECKSKGERKSGTGSSENKDQMVPLLHILNFDMRGILCDRDATVANVQFPILLLFTSAALRFQALQT